MTTGQEIETAFRTRGVVRGGILFLRAADAIALVEAARQKGVRVLGIDAFRLGADFTQPLMEHSVDLSSHKTADTWTVASDFVRRQNGDLFFEVVLEKIPLASPADESLRVCWRRSVSNSDPLALCSFVPPIPRSNIRPGMFMEAALNGITTTRDHPLGSIP